MGLQEQLERLLNAYSRHYDIKRDVQTEGGFFPAEAVFYLRDEHYLVRRDKRFYAVERPLSSGGTGRGEASQGAYVFLRHPGGPGGDHDAGGAKALEADAVPEELPVCAAWIHGVPRGSSGAVRGTG